MKKIIISFISFGILFIPQISFSFTNQVDKVTNKEEDRKVEFSPYGFIKGDFVYATDGVNSFDNHNLVAPQIANGIKENTHGFTAQHTRLGIRGSTVEDVKVGGLAEIDFLGSGFNTNTNPRMRLTYLTVASDGFEARIGQQWYLFSPYNPITNNTNANMWFAGNEEFRRAQIQLSYELEKENIAPKLQVSIGEAASESAGLGKDNLSDFPMFQTRISGKILNTYTLGLSYFNARFFERAGTEIDDNYIIVSDINIEASGLCVDFNLPIHEYFALTGELNSIKNLRNANLFSIAGNLEFLF